MSYHSKKLNFYFFVTLVFFLSLFVHSLETKAATTIVPSNVSLYEATQDIQIKDGDQFVATINKGAFYYLEQGTNNSLSIQYGANELQVDPSLFLKMGDTQTIKVPDYVSTTTESGKQLDLTSYNIGVDPDSSVSIVEFAKVGSYPIYQETNTDYQIILGNRLVSVKKPVAQTTSTSTTQTTTTQTQQTAVTTPTTTTTTTSTATKSSTFTTFTGSEKYFKVQTGPVPVYVNKNGTNVEVGQLDAGQEFVILSQSNGYLQIQFGNSTGLVNANAVVPSDGASIKNLNKYQVNSDRYFKTYRSLPVYDNTSGSLVEFSRIDTGNEYSVIKQTSPNWFEISFGGRIGFVYVPYLQELVNQSDHFFTPFLTDVPVYLNEGGSSVLVGTLKKGQEYQIAGLTTGFVKIKYGNNYGYVRTGSITPSSGSTIKDLNTGLTNSAKVLRTYRTLSVYDNTSGSLVEFGQLYQGQDYNYIKQSSNDWIMLNLAGRLGYIYVPHAILPIASTDKYFKTVYAVTPVVSNSDQGLGTLAGGQEFQILGQTTNFVKIQYGNGIAYVRKSYVSESNGTTIHNRTVGTPAAIRTFTANYSTEIYDNTSGSLVTMGKLNPGNSYQMIQDSSTYWIKVNFGNRIGYVYKPHVSLAFAPSDAYFYPIDSDVPVYVNQNGTNVKMATLKKQQKYVINAQIPGFMRINYGNTFGYVRTSDVYPTDANNIHNLNTGLGNSYITFKTTRVEEVYDNSVSPMQVFTTLEAGQTYPIIMQSSANWLEVSVGGRIGYVYKPHVQIGPIKIYTTTNYSTTFTDFFNTQYATVPQTDKYYDTYVSASYITKTSSTSGTVNVSSLNVRGGPSTDFWVVGTLSQNQTVNILATSVTSSGTWYKINFPITWKNASPDDTRYYMDPSSAQSNSNDYYEFLKLNQSADLNADEVNSKILAGKGILANEAQAFITAGTTYHVNEIYLISHALLETGNGTSALATGVLVSSVNGQSVTPRVVYNMFGINAFDTCPLTCGAEKAYQEGWFTPEAAIIGGAKYISESYINDPAHYQDTLYKMKWNPQDPGTHEYATDIGWAFKQCEKIAQLYSLINNYTVTFDLPVFK